ncbi:MAG: hypothetical protein AB1601_01640 [Planctomycetota bacterium]
MTLPEPKRCLGCGYILQGLPENRCPECGRTFDPRDQRTYYTTRVSGRRYLAVTTAGLVGLLLSWWLATVCFDPTAPISILCATLVVVVSLGVFVCLAMDAWRAILVPRHLVQHRLALKAALMIAVLVVGELVAAALGTVVIALGAC